jgi:hypothetical protein
MNMHTHKLCRAEQSSRIRNISFVIKCKTENNERNAGSMTYLLKGIYIKTSESHVWNLGPNNQ